MQLTKDDVKEFEYDVPNTYLIELKKKFLDYSKFQRVVEFYEKYKITVGQDNPGFLLFIDEQPELYKKYNEERMKLSFGKLHYNNWLFKYCFKDGLK